jgi:single-stranded DNA-binding protein
MDTKKDFQKAIENTRNNLHKGLEIMFQVKVQTRKVEIKINQKRMENKIEVNQREFQTEVKEVGPRVKHGRGTGTGADAAKPPKFNGTTLWAMFWRQFDTVAEHNCWMPQEKPNA